MASMVTSTVTIVVLSSFSSVRLFTSSWKNAYSHPLSSPTAMPTAESDGARAQQRRQDDDDEAGDRDTERQVDELLRARAEESRRKERDPHRLHEEEERRDRDTCQPDGEEVGEQGAAVQGADQQEPEPEVAPQEHGERPAAPEHDDESGGGKGHAQDDQDAGRCVRPAHERAAEADEDEAGGDQAVAGQVAP